MNRKVTLGLIVLLLSATFLFFGAVKAESSYLFESGYETGDYSEYTSTSGSPTISSAYVHLGNYSSRITTTTGGQSEYAVKDLGTTYAGLYARHYVMWSYGAPAVDDDDGLHLFSVAEGTGLTDGKVIAMVYNDGSTYNWSLNCGVDYDWATHVSNITVSGASNTTWYNVKIYASNTYATLWVDDALVLNVTGLSLGASWQYLISGTSYSGAGSLGFYLDDAAISESDISETESAVTYTVAITYVPEGVILKGALVTFTLNITGSDGSALTDFTANVTRNSEMFLEGWTNTTFTDTEPTAQSHDYNITGLTDGSSDVLAYTVTPAVVTWTEASNGEGGSTVGNNDLNDNNGVSPSPSEQPFQLPDLTPKDQTNIIVLVIVVCVGLVLALVITQRKETRESRRKNFRNNKRKGSQLGKKKPKRKGYFEQ